MRDNGPFATGRAPAARPAIPAMSESSPGVSPPSATCAASTASPGRVARATWGTMALFFVNGATFATWGVHIPTIKARFGLSDAMLSFAMLAVAGGAIAAMGPVGRWVARVGSARASMASGLAYALATVMILAMPDFRLLLPALAVFGMANAAFDVGMNAQAATVEACRTHP